MSSVDQAQINGALWAACEVFRADSPQRQGRDHVLALVFVKYLSDLRHDALSGDRPGYGMDQAREPHRLGRARFVWPNVEVHEMSGQFVIDRFLADIYELNIRREQTNLAALVDLALAALEAHNKDRLTGLFCHVRFDSEAALGPAPRRNARLKQLIAMLAYLDLRSHPGAVVSAFCDLIERFAQEGGKNAAAPPVPPCVARLMLALARGNIACIADPVCGSGGLLLAAAQHAGQRHVRLFGQEADQAALAMARMRLIMHGLDDARLELGDSLAKPLLLADGHLMQFDTVLASVPRQRPQWQSGHPEQDAFGRYWRGVPPRGKADYAYICHCLAITRPQSGQLLMLAPHSVLFRGGTEKRIRQHLLAENLLDAVLALPAHFFPHAQVPQVLLLFDRSREAGGARAHVRDVLFMDTTGGTAVGTGVAAGSGYALQAIVQDVQARRPQGRRVYLASSEEIAANEHDLNLSRYLFEPRQNQVHDLALARREIDEMEVQLASLRSRLRALGDWIAP
jgi:type I restriction enzyme M protein